MPLLFYPSQVFSRFSGLLQMRSVGSVMLQRLSREGLAWAPCIGNICTGIAFLMAMALNVYVTGQATSARRGANAGRGKDEGSLTGLQDVVA